MGSSLINTMATEEVVQVFLLTYAGTNSCYPVTTLATIQYSKLIQAIPDLPLSKGQRHYLSADLVKGRIHTDMSLCARIICVVMEIGDDIEHLNYSDMEPRSSQAGVSKPLNDIIMQIYISY